MRRTHRILVRDVVAHAAKIFDIPVADIMGRGRFGHISKARQAVMLVARQNCKQSYSAIAMALKRDCHTTVIHGCGSAIERARRDPEYAARIRLLRTLAKRGRPFEASAQAQASRTLKFASQPHANIVPEVHTREVTQSTSTYREDRVFAILRTSARMRTEYPSCAEIGTRLGVRRKTVVGILKRLEVRGLVRIVRRKTGEITAEICEQLA